MMEPIHTIKSSAMAAFCARIKLAEATGLDREQVVRAEGILPATRFIGNEYLNLVRTRPFVECVASHCADRTFFA